MRNNLLQVRHNFCHYNCNNLVYNVLFYITHRYGHTIVKQPHHQHTTNNNNQQSIQQYNNNNNNNDITTTGQLYTYGSGSFAGLCNNDNSYRDKQQLTRIESVKNIEFKSISSGWCNNLAIDMNNKLYIFGWHNRIQSLLFAAKMSSQYTRIFNKLQSIQYNTRFVFRPKQNTLQPTLVTTYEIEIDNKPHMSTELPDIVYTSCGSDFSACIDSNGYVYTTGNGYWGQLGHDKSINNTNLKHYKRIELLKDIRIIQVSCGFNHIVMLCDTGHVYVCGRCKDGQLGIKNVEHSGYRVFLPHIVPSTAQDMHDIDVHPYIGHIKQIATGMRHTLMLNDNGQVYGTGGNIFGECAQIDSFSTVYVPQHISSIKHKVIKIASGNHHCVALCSDQRTIYTWGLGKHGQCAQPQSYAIANTTTKNKMMHKQKYIYRPHRINLSHILDKHDIIINITCGFYDTVLYTQQGKTIIFGGLADQNNENYTPKLLTKNNNIYIKQVSFGLAHMCALVDNNNNHNIDSIKV